MSDAHDRKGPPSPDPVWCDLGRLVDEARARGAVPELDDAALRRAHELLDAIEARKDVDLVIQPTSEIFKPLAPRHHPIGKFAMCPGPPTLFLAYSFGGKTVMLQDMALAVAMGEKVWWQFPVEPGRVLHIDYEQGADETYDRYQRLARGRGLFFEDIVSAGRLGVVSLPPIYLNSTRAVEAYKRACDGCVLVFIDTFGASVPGEDENDANIRRWLDLLTPVSLSTGAVFVVAHHMAKAALTDQGARADLRTLAKGNNAIFNAAGYAYVTGGAKGQPKLVQQAKGRGLGDPIVEDFYLELSTVDVRRPDVDSGWQGYFNPANANDPGGFRVVYKTVEQIKPPKTEKDNEDLEQDCAALVSYIRKENAHGRGVGSGGAAAKGAKVRKSDGMDAFKTLKARDLIERRGKGDLKAWWLTNRLPMGGSKEGGTGGGTDGSGGSQSVPDARTGSAWAGGGGTGGGSQGPPLGGTCETGAVPPRPVPPRDALGESIVLVLAEHPGCSGRVLREALGVRWPAIEASLKALEDQRRIRVERPEKQGVPMRFWSLGSGTGQLGDPPGSGGTGGTLTLIETGTVDRGGTER